MKDLIKIKLGMEFGAQAHHVKYFQNIFNKYDFYFIIIYFNIV